ncbi:hypothetical protein B0T18DRAFT_394757 [Schizothecium vesticola]|uniref:Extracellular membrane protein CFEM domain-containing protein n=1 Tax=Schizothecium vesticola TaxID=314040 RepID=A0AA40BQE5_9PEZI|nr:hypothetical protein B0T18DRAFT_394757 [Schizothecium vesticola]
MRRPSTPRPPRWTALLCMASTASALTLSSFQLITSSGTPIACLIVYSSPLAGCSTRDFTSGTACSPACVAGIADVQSRIVDVCDGVDASSASVLGQAQRGNLVPLLCPSSRGAAPQQPTRSRPPPEEDQPPASDLPPPPAPAQPTPTFVQSERPAQRPTSTSGGGRPQATRDSESGGGSPFDTLVVGQKS